MQNSGNNTKNRTPLFAAARSSYFADYLMKRLFFFIERSFLFMGRFYLSIIMPFSEFIFIEGSRVSGFSPLFPKPDTRTREPVIKDYDGIYCLWHNSLLSYKCRRISGLEVGACPGTASVPGIGAARSRAVGIAGLVSGFSG